VRKIKTLEALFEEHSLIDKTLDAFLAWAARLRDGERQAPGRLDDFSRFFEDFVIHFHHKKEEEILFKFLARRPLPRNRGPLYFMDLEHRENITRLDILRKSAAEASLNKGDKNAFYGQVLEYCAHIWEHIDKENSVLFPESATLLMGEDAREMDRLHALFEENAEGVGALKNIAERLCREFPPMAEEKDVIRGDGCPMCRHYGKGCEGIEQEWWTESQWDLIHDLTGE